MGLFSKSPETGLVSEAPRILVVDDVASPEECEHMISLVADQLEPAQIITQDGEATSTLRRTADVGWVETNQTAVVRELVDRVAELAELPARNVERIQVVHYEAGGQHSMHVDAFDADKDAASLRRDGQRLKTGLLYLAEPRMGGSTSFPKAKPKAKVKPKVGRLVLFDLVVPGTIEPDMTAIHAGNPVARGEKWACNFWFCERAVKRTKTKNKKKRR